VSGVVLAAALATYVLLAPPDAQPELARALKITGVTGWFPDYPRILNRWIVGERLLPLTWIAAVTAAAGYWLWRERGTATLPAWTLLLALAWTQWLAWQLRAPIPHLRYLWPGLGLFAAAVGHTLATMHRAAGPGQRVGRVACLGLALVCMAGPLGSAFRNLLNGSTDVVMWEWSGETALSYTRRFQNVQDQRAAAEWLREHIDPDEALVTLSQPFALRYLSGRPVRAIWTLLDDEGVHWTAPRPSWVVLQPHNRTFRYLTPEADAWIAENCHLASVFGSYTIYRVHGTWPEDMTPFRLAPRPDVRFPLAPPTFGPGS